MLFTGGEGAGGHHAKDSFKSTRAKRYRRSMDASPRRQRDVRIVDRTWERVTALNQFTLGGIVLVVSAVLAITSASADFSLFIVGVTLIFVASGVALMLPWAKIRPAWSALLPIVDIAAIAFLRESAPTASLELLWVLPAIWLPAQFGLQGLAMCLTGVVTLSVIEVITHRGEDFTVGLVLLPLLLTVVSSMTYATARRTDARRRLLHKQSRMLEGALARARRQESTVTQILDAVDFGVIRITPDGEVSMKNEAQGRLQIIDSLIPDEAEVVTLAGDGSHETMKIAYHDDGVTRLLPEERPFARALKGEEVEGEIIWFGMPGTPRRAFSVTVRRMYDAEGDDDGAVLVSRDVTAELSAIRSREDFVASVSHELRTPLTSILGYIELVLDDDLSPSSRRGLEVAGRNANRLLAIIADILAASSSGGSMVEMAIEQDDTDLAEIVRASVEAFTPRAAERRITIDTAGIEPAMAYIDAARMRQVVDNLISNAIKYNRDAGTIEIGCTSDGRNAWLIVRDNGVGISEEELPRLFERFFRAEAVRKTSTHGSGLGLSISREIVRLHRGELTVTSALGEGTTLVARLPVHPRRKDMK